MLAREHIGPGGTDTAGGVPSLAISRFRLRYRFPENALLPEYQGSTWRGAMGHSLKRTACVTRLGSCPACSLYRSCPYPYLFETPVPEDATRMRKYTSAPHPFILEAPPLGYRPEPGRDYLLGLAVLGNGNRHAPYLLHALRRAGEEGIGKGRVPFELTGLEQELPVGSDRWRDLLSDEEGGLCLAAPDESAPPLPEAHLRLTLFTPLRLVSGGRLVGPDTLRFRHLFSSLLRRISMLMYFHHGSELEVDYRSLTEQAAEVSFLRASFRWQDWTRYSSRQRRPVRMGGVVGEAVLDSRELEPFWPYLWLGQWVHTGKGTSMGLGGYRIGALD